MHTVDTKAFYAFRRREWESQHSDDFLFLLMRTDRGNILGVWCSFWVRRRVIWEPSHTSNKGLVKIQYKCLIWISFSLKPNKKLATRINCFHLWSIIFQIGNLYVGNLCELSAQPQEKRGGQGTAANLCLTPVPCLSLRSWDWAKSSFTKIDLSWENMNRFQIHKCRTWEQGRAISFLRIFASNFCYSADHRLYRQRFRPFPYIGRRGGHQIGNWMGPQRLFRHW